MLIFFSILVEESRTRHEQLQSERESLAQQLRAATEAHASANATSCERVSALEQQVAQQANEREGLERSLQEAQAKLSEALTQSTHTLHPHDTRVRVRSRITRHKLYSY